MKPHYQTYKPDRGIKHEPLWAILTICAIAGIMTVLFLYAAGILTK